MTLMKRIIRKGSVKIFSFFLIEIKDIVSGIGEIVFQIKGFLF